jgi:hypothetical protein
MKIFNKFLVLCIAAFFISCDTDPILSEANVVSFEESSKSLAIDVGSSVKGFTLTLSGLNIPAMVIIIGGSQEGLVNFTINYNDKLSTILIILSGIF